MGRGAVERAAEVIADQVCSLNTLGCDEHQTESGDHCLSLLWYHELGEHIAQALADAGLLLSDVDRAVLDAADAWGLARDAWYATRDLEVGQALTEAQNALDAAVRARRETR